MSGSDLRAGECGPPLIGITGYLEQAQCLVWDVRASFLPEAYLRAVTDVGGAVAVLPPQPVDRAVAARIVEGIDGLIVSGGADIDPRRYGQAAHERTGAPREDRDAFEDALIRAALDAELPFLGICRGAQLLNVVLGGDLIQHLPDRVGDDRHQLGGGRFNPIEVEVEPGSRIAELYGDAPTATAHLYHHQAIGEVAEPLAVTSRTADGVIEAIELPGAPFCVAVQWHPEAHEEDRRLFAGLVEAARAHRPLRRRTTPSPLTHTSKEHT